MPTLTTFPTHLPLVLPPAERGLLVMLGPHLSNLHPAVLSQAARLVGSLTQDTSPGGRAHPAGGLLCLLDCGNCLDLYGLARQLRHFSPRPERLLERIRVARAFTCYQAASLLSQSALNPHPLPVIVLDLLSTFMDENVPLGERQRLLRDCLAHLDNLASQVPVLVTARSAILPECQPLLNSLGQAADHLWMPAPAPAAYQQASFW